jgi:HAD superfamily hydrolase (TIGR01509 family)
MQDKKMDISKIKAIIFDMDGVLVDSEPIHAKAEMQTCSEFGMNVLADEWENFRGKKLEDIFSHASQKYGTGKEPIEEMINRKIRLYLDYALKEIDLILGTREFLTSVKNSDYRYALTTSGRKFQQDQILDKFGLKNFFEITVTADDVKNGKPDPEPYLKTIEKLGEKAENCLVIEDSDNGVISGKRAGCRVCGITNTFPKEKLEAVGADVIVKNFEELAKILKI